MRLAMPLCLGMALGLAPAAMAQQGGSAKRATGVADEAIGSLEINGATVSELTAAECTSLGGTVFEEGLGLCKSGKLCGTTDENGQRHRVCLEAEVKPEDGGGTKRKPAAAGLAADAVTGSGGGLAADATTVEELTTQECAGLGGLAIPLAPGNPEKCTGTQLCATTDKNGVIHVACIDEKSAD